MIFRRTFFLCALLALVACRGNQSGDGNDAATAANGQTPLPRPEAPGGSVTGMPSRPGPGPVGPQVAAEATPLPEAASSGAPAPVSVDGSVAPEGGPVVADAGVAAPEEPTPQEAAAIVRDYYGAISAHEYGRAYALWSDGGRASGMTAQQFADGFANTERVLVQVGAPGRVDAAAGSRYVQIPVSLEATQRDGSVRNYAGNYTLRRATADGATPEQRVWRIASAEIHENAGK